MRRIVDQPPAKSRGRSDRRHHVRSLRRRAWDARCVAGGLAVGYGKAHRRRANARRTNVRAGPLLRRQSARPLGDQSLLPLALTRPRCTCSLRLTPSQELWIKARLQNLMCWAWQSLPQPRSGPGSSSPQTPWSRGHWKDAERCRASRAKVSSRTDHLVRSVEQRRVTRCALPSKRPACSTICTNAPCVD
jgi:hypothetical protein